MKYVVVQEIKSETKVTKNIYLFDFFFLLAYVTGTFMLGVVVHSSLKILFYIFSIGCGIFLTMRSSWNKKRRNWESLILFLTKDRDIYTPLNNNSVATELDRKRREEICDKNDW